MKLRKIASPFVLLTCVCFALLSGCSTVEGGHAPIVTGTASPETRTPTVPAIASSTALPTDCPTSGTIRPIHLPTSIGTAQPAVLYLTAWGGVQSGFHPLDLIRYDLTTHKAIPLLSFSGNPTGFIPRFQLSPDKHWLLIQYPWKLNATEIITVVRLLRTDGTQQQTLACFSSEAGLSAAHWLPDGQQIALTTEQYNQQKARLFTVDVLNLATGKAQTVLSGAYSPSLWLDDHRLIVENTTTTDRADFFLFDINQGSQQKLTALTPIASFPIWGSFVYGEIAVSLDGSQLFTSSFSQAKTNPANCQGPTAQGPATVHASGITGASPHVIYSSQNQAILTIAPVSSHTLLLYIGNNTGDLSQNGLWKINTDGTALTRLTTANDWQCQNLGYWEWLPQVASNNQSYALLQTDTTKEYSQSIVVGNLCGGAPTTIATSASIRTQADFDHFLQLVGMT